MGNGRSDSSENNEVGENRSPEKSPRKKGPTGNLRGKSRQQQSDAELIDRLFRQRTEVIDNGQRVLRSGFEIIFKQLLAKESGGNRAAARTRDRYSRFAIVNHASGGFLLRYAQNDFTRQFAAALTQGGAEKQTTVPPESEAAPPPPRGDEPARAER